MARVDLTVRGGGIFGLACAWEATRRGARVRLIEQVQIGAGASGGLVGALAPHAPEQWTEAKAFQLQALLMADAFWAEVETAAALPSGYARTGRLQPLADDAAIALAQQRAAAAAHLWQGQAEWRVIPWPGAHAPQSASGFVIHDTLSARLHPRMAAAALAAAITAKGGEIILGDAPAEGPVIWATGAAGLDMLSEAAGQKVGSGVKGQAASFHCPGLEWAPQIYADALHIVPHADGTVAIGSTSETTWTDASRADEQLDVLIAKARVILPALQEAPIIARWAGIRPKAKSRQPLLGPWPGRPGQFIANGGFKIGFGIAPNIARTLIDLILDGKDQIPTPFRPDPAWSELRA